MCVLLSNLQEMLRWMVLFTGSSSMSTYTFVDGPTFTMKKEEGQAKIHFDGFSPKKVFTIEFIPTDGMKI